MKKTLSALSFGIIEQARPPESARKKRWKVDVILSLLDELDDKTKNNLKKKYQKWLNQGSTLQISEEEMTFDFFTVAGIIDSELDKTIPEIFTTAQNELIFHGDIADTLNSVRIKLENHSDELLKNIRSQRESSDEDHEFRKAIIRVAIRDMVLIRQIKLHSELNIKFYFKNIFKNN